MAISFGITINAFSVLTLPLIETFNCTNEQAARVATVFIITMTLSMPAVGWLLDHMAPRPVMALGAVITGIGYYMAAQSADINMFTIGMALCGVGIGASAYIPAFTLIAHWMPLKRQGLAFGVLLAVAAVGGIVFPIALTRMIAAYGWRSSMEAGAALIVFVCLPILLALVRLPQQTTLVAHPQADSHLGGVSVGAALRTGRYWLWIAMFLPRALHSRRGERHRHDLA